MGMLLRKESRTKIPPPVAAGRSPCVARLLQLCDDRVKSIVGYLWMLWDKERQTWHDKIATTERVWIGAAAPCAIGGALALVVEGTLPARARRTPVPLAA